MPCEKGLFEFYKGETMQILQSWKESLLIFKPSNFKLFLMVTVKSILETYKLLLCYFWWLVLLYVFFSVLVYAFFFSDSQILAFLFLAIMFVTFLIVRPSVERKGYSYFSKKLLYIGLIGIFYPIIVFLVLFFTVLFFSVLGIPFPFWLRIILAPFIGFIAPVFFLFVTPLSIFYTLFALDSDIDMRAIDSYTMRIAKIMKIFGEAFFRAGKMVLFSYPFCFVSYLLFYGMYQSLHWIIPYPLFFRFFHLLLLPILICIFANFYIKQVHEHFDLYFGKGPSEK